ncbi:hypothetical protein [Anaerosporobacter faecicola]|uniref:hypothetical protein n=1 Tax=Anaerosporobacter faecicola TaxID=2718714 RepID=UPI00143BF323|nr:hypothetical protein [Anaerosporobacter faecicola]
MKKVLPIILVLLLFCSGCRQSKTPDANNKGEQQTITEEDKDKHRNGEEVQRAHLNLKDNEWYFIGDNDLDYGYEKVVFFDSDMNVMKYFENAVLPNNSMGTIDTSKPVVLGVLDEEKRKGTIIEPNQYTYGLYDLKNDLWIIPMEYSSLIRYDNDCYVATLYNEELDTTTMTIYDLQGDVLNEGVDLTNRYVACLGSYLWTVSYDGEQPIEIYDSMGTCTRTLAKSYGMVHGAYFVASSMDTGDIIYDGAGEPAVTKEIVVKTCKLKDVENEHFFVVNYNDYSQMIEAQIGKYQLILKKDGSLVSCINQEEYPDKRVSVEYWLYCVTDSTNVVDSQKEDAVKVAGVDGVDFNEEADEESIGDESDSLDSDNEEYGIVTDKEETIYDETKNEGNIAYYDQEGNHLVTTTGEEFQGHLQPYGVDFTPHALFYKNENGFEIYDYECQETYQYAIKEFGIVEIQSPLQGYYMITNELDEETNISIYYKDTLLAEGSNLVIQVLNGDMIISDYSEEYALDEVSQIYDRKGRKVYESPCYEAIEQIGTNYLLVQREGIRTIVDYDGNVVCAFDGEIQVQPQE